MLSFLKKKNPKLKTNNIAKMQIFEYSLEREILRSMLPQHFLTRYDKIPDYILENILINGFEHEFVEHQKELYKNTINSSTGKPYPLVDHSLNDAPLEKGFFDSYKIDNMVDIFKDKLFMTLNGIYNENPYSVGIIQSQIGSLNSKTNLKFDDILEDDDYKLL